MPSVAVRNRQRKISVNVPALQEFASRALPRCLALALPGKRADASLFDIYVLLISDRRMSGLHQKFLKKRGPTDVITFEHGEIFISIETARRNARRFGNSFQGELKLYLVHGFLHLAGFDDRNEADARKMRAAQERILRTVF